MYHEFRFVKCTCSVGLNRKNANSQAGVCPVVGNKKEERLRQAAQEKR